MTRTTETVAIRQPRTLVVCEGKVWIRVTPGGDVTIEHSDSPRRGIELTVAPATPNRLTLRIQAGAFAGPLIPHLEGEAGAAQHGLVVEQGDPPR
jgi:hypothetical protein